LLEQYQAAPASHEWMLQHLGKSTRVFGEVPIGELDALMIARWRAGLPETMRHGAHRALRQVLAAAVRWQWINRNVATDVPNPMHARLEFNPFESWEEVDALARELGPFGPLAIFCVGTGVRPEEAFGADWTDVDLQAAVFTVRRAFAKGRLKPYPKTERSRRRVPLRARVLDALDELPHREGVLFAAAGGGRIDIDNFRSREWVPALKAAGLSHRRIYDMRHTFATWSLAAGMSIFTLARRMGTSLQMRPHLRPLGAGRRGPGPGPAGRPRCGHPQRQWARCGHGDRRGRGAVSGKGARLQEWSQPGSNRRPPACKAGALPAELWPLAS
jgi:integrase